ncbi:preprotein translocase subunit SecD [uncultured Clostridium sp.]|uniref:protein translocase subunit SecD n=1 Tax=uncultured Clostridium sp. TaxID=59620 RepID=UPI0008226A1D|nr:protein translocase subunit SecD [uncultured Clostridium sp.]SCJ99294.1 preprotein translocase subunit SecD [uncultured Clostridium sp.]
MKKGRSATLFILAVIIIISLTFAGFKGVEIGGWEFKSFDKAITKGLDLQGGVSVLMEITDENLSSEDLEKNLEKTKQLLDLRVNKLGVAETTVTAEGDRRIRIDIPGQFDSKEIVDSLQKTGNLTFKDSEGNEVLNGKDVEEASVMTDNTTGKPVVTLKLNEEGKQKFAEATEKNLNKTISIYMDEDLISSPVVESVISGGEAIITGSKTIDEAKNLAGLINSGALPVTLKVASIESVGAQLGAEAMPNAMKAGAVGILLIFLFMIFNYRMLGVIASITLTLYTMLVLIVFVEANVTLTLPGIAGFLLTIGMAVDANVLIFERIKEEMAKGVSAKSAVKSGFHNALSSIVDSNVTTVIAALVLYFMGTGPVKGFAVTLMIGIALSMFTAIFITRKLTEWAINMGMLSKPWHFKVKRG